MRILICLVGLAPTFASAQTTDPSNYATSVYREVAATGSTADPIRFNGGGGNSINPAAQQGQNSQSGGSGANMAAGAALLAACMMTQPPNMALCAMGAMAMMQGGHDKDAAKQSQATYQASSNSGATGTNTSPTYTDPSKGTGAYSDTVKAGLQSLDDAGIKVSESGVTMPDGTKVKASSMGNSAAMTAAGFDAKSVADAKKVTDALNAEMANGARVSSVGMSEGGGGGGGGAGAAADNAANENGGATLPPGFDPFGTGGAAARSRALAGKTVNFDGEPIGVRGNNIFEMVHNCYQRKRAGNHFIEAEASAVVRAPASASSVRPSSVRRK